MHQETSVTEVLRLPSPAPLPQALACDGDHLWLGSWETERIYGIDRAKFTVFEEKVAPGKPVGMVSVGDDLRAVVADAEDHRFIRCYVPGHGFRPDEATPCPNDTGSFLAFDGDSLWLSQRHNQKVLELDAKANPRFEIGTDAQILGIAWVREELYLSLWYGREGGGKIARMSRERTRIETIASLGFAGISLTHDGEHFWTNETRKNQIVAFALG